MRTIFLTFATTIAAISFAATLFLNTILGTFGLVTTSVNNLSKLKSSQIVMDKMKSRHQVKKLNVTKKLAKRSSRRVASASLAAATIGTLAVAVTITGFEIIDYCEDRESLHIDSNILYGTTDEFDFEACIEEGKSESKRIITDVKQSSNQLLNEAMNSAVRYSNEQWQTLKEAHQDTLLSANQTLETLKADIMKWLMEY
jgi:vacuolar-type H+-ATPase subunit H